MPLTTLVRLHQHEQLSEYLAQISSIDLVNEQDIRAIRILVGRTAKANKWAISKSELACLGRRAVAPDEVLVTIRRVKPMAAIYLSATSPMSA